MASFFRSLFKKEPGDTGPVPPPNGRSGHASNGHAGEEPFISPFAQQPQSSPFAAQAPSQDTPPPASPFAGGAFGAAPQGDQMTVRELASLLPQQWVRPEAAGSDLPVTLPLEALRRGLLSGRPVLRLTELQAACPQLFARPVHPSEDMEVAMPLSRVRRLVENAGASHHEAGAPFAPAAPTAWPGKSPFSPATSPVAEAFSPFGAAPPAGQVKSPFAPAEPAPAPAGAPFSPFDTPPTQAGAPGKSPFLPAAEGNAPAPLSPFASPPAAVGPGKSPFFPAEPPPSTGPAPGPSASAGPAFVSPFSAPPAAAAPRQSPFAAPAPGPFPGPAPAVSPPASPFAPPAGSSDARVPLAAVASVAATPAASPFSPFIAASAAVPPRTQPVPAAAPLSPFQAASPAAPGASPFDAPSPFKAPSAPDREAVSLPLPSFPPAARPSPPTPPAAESPAAAVVKPAPSTPVEALPPIAPLSPPREHAPAPALPPVSGPVPQASGQAAAAAADSARHSGKMELSLRAVLRDVPEQVLGFNYQLVPDSVRVSLPVARIVPQMATGRILLKVNEVRDGLLERYRPAFAKAPADLEISVPLSEVFHNLPESERPGLVPETRPQPAAAPSFQTPFSLKAVEDQERLRLPETPRPAPRLPEAPAPAAGIVLPPLLARPAPPLPEASPPAAGHVTGLSSPPQPFRGTAPLEDGGAGGDELGAAFSAASLRAEPPFRTGPVPVSAPRTTAPVPVPAQGLSPRKPEVPAPAEDTAAAAAAASLPVAPPVTPAPAPPPVKTAAPAPATPAGTAAGKIEDLGFGYHSDLSQMMLRAVYGTDRRLTPSDVVNLAGALPGLAGCVLLAGDHTLASENLHGTPAEAFPATARRTLDSLTCLAETLGFGDAGNFTLRSDHGVRTFFLERGVCLAVFHEQPSFLPGVREKLILTARELGAMSAP